MKEFLKKNKLYVGLTLMAESIAFLSLFFVLLKKKKNLATIMMILSAACQTGALFCIAHTMKEQEEAFTRAASEAANLPEATEVDDFECTLGEQKAATPKESEPAEEETPDETILASVEDETAEIPEFDLSDDLKEI